MKMNQRVQWLLFTFIVGLLVMVNCSDNIRINNELNGLPNDLSSRRLKGSLTYDSIEKIDVNCVNSSGMLVSIDFKRIFNGTIYSQGYFNDPKCRFVRPNSNARHFAFNIPYNSCGSKPSCSICSSVDNILIIQNNNSVQDELSTARKISCEHGSDQREKTVFFKPFIVDMLEVIKVETSSGSVECWMDIGLGSPPHLTPITSSLKLGQDLTFTINLKQTIEKWDVNILRCYAYDDANFDAKSTKILQISDKNGCSLQKSIFGEWKKLEMKFASENTLTYYNTLKVFKFPDRSHVFLKCDIELCSGVCERNNDCHSNLSVEKSKEQYIFSTTETPRISYNSKCYEGSTGAACRGQDNTAISTTARPSPLTQCYPGSSDPACKQFMNGRIKVVNSNEFTSSNCFPGSKDLNCADSTNLKYFSTQKSTKAPAYLPPFTKKPLKDMGTINKYTCIAGSNDPKCVQTPKTIIKTTSVTSCYPGTTDPKCSQTEPTPNSTVTPCIPGSTDSNCYQGSQIPPCFPGSSDPKCLQNIQTTRNVVTTITPCYPGSTEPKCIQKSKVNIKPRCYPGSNDPNCLKAEITASDQICYPGFTDSRCRQVMKSTKAPEYLPPTTKGKIAPKTTTTCSSSSTDPFCSQTIRTTSKPVTKATTAPLCFLGSTDPACLVNQKTTIVKTLGSSKITTALFCYPGSLDRSCPQTQTTVAPLCSQGSNDPNCLKNTKQPSEFSKTTKGPIYLPPNNIEKGGQECNFGSTNPRCAQATKVLTTSKPICFPGTKDLGCQKIKNTATKSTNEAKPEPSIQNNTEFLYVKKNDCPPGSKNPKCPNIATTQNPDCYIGSKSRRCQPPTHLPPPTTRRSRLSTQEPEVFTLKLSCYPGSKSPECQETKSTTTLSNCYTGSTDPRCREATQQGCYTDSKSPKCQPETYLPPKNIPTKTTQQSKVTYVPSNTITTNRPEYTTRKSDCYPGSKSPKCQLVTYNPPTSIPNPIQKSSTTTPSLRCYQVSKDSKCPQINTTTKSPTTKTKGCLAESLEPECLNCYPGSPDPKCQKLPPTVNSPTTSGSKVPILNTTASNPSCYPGTKDVRCTQVINITTKLITTFKCLPGSSDPVCKNELPGPNCYTGSTDPRCLNATQKLKSPCYPGSPDPKCSNIKHTSDCYTGSKSPKCQPKGYLPPNNSLKTTQPPKVTYLPITVTAARCYPGSPNPQCVQTTKEPIAFTTNSKPSCYPDSKDTRCLQTITNTKMMETETKCLPGSLESECLHCFPGSPDPKCPKIPTTAKIGCYPGSPDPKCQLATYLPPLTRKNIPKTTPKAIPVSTLPSICSQGSTEIRCKENVPITTKPGCYLDSKSPECQLDTYLPPMNTTTDQKTTPKFCYPGSTDSNCNKQQIPTTKKPSTTKPTSPYYCYPGSIDPRCPDAGYKGTSLVPATYLPPLQDVSYDRTIRASKLNLLNGINQLALNNDVFIDLDEDVDEVEEQQILPIRNKRDAGSIHDKYVPSQPEKQIIYLTVGVLNAFTVP